jgi:tetratricopeptide (TPR) repeat protein
MLRAKEQVEIAEQRAAQEGTEEAHEQVEKLREEQARLEFEIYKNRCDRNPDDASLQFQLGVRLKRLGNFRESLDRLKAGLEVPEHRASASLEIGEILQRYQQFPRALQCYRQAAQLAVGNPGATECRKRALYRAGALATIMKLTDSARQYLEELVKMDPNYLDAKSRLDKLAEMSEDL